MRLDSRRRHLDCAAEQTLHLNHTSMHALPPVSECRLSDPHLIINTAGKLSCF